MYLSIQIMLTGTTRSRIYSAIGKTLLNLQN